MLEQTIIYLDSNDYSTMSNGSLSEAQACLLDDLLRLKADPNVSFAFSGAHISEMAPVDESYADAGIRRTTLLVDLCGRNAMISFDRLIQAELENLRSLNDQPVAAIDRNGQWFPELGALVSPLSAFDIQAAVKEHSKEASMNRETRRRLKATMTKKNGGFRADLDKRIGTPDVDELIATFPMRPRDGKVLQNYLLGKVSRNAADQAFVESLRDPSYMAQWFRKHHDRLGAIGDWVRRPSQDLIATMEGVLDLHRTQLETLSEDEKKSALSSLSGAFWAKAQEQGMLDIVNRLISRFHPGEPKCEDVALIDRYCPGLSTCLSVFYSSMRNSLGANPRTMKKSDFVDVIHALYVPYVSYFRADAYMANIIRPYAKRFDTQVMGSPAQLVAALKTRAE